MSFLQDLRHAPRGVLEAVERVFSPSKASDLTGPGPYGPSFNDWSGGPSFDSISDFISFYKSEAFNVAYTNMDPFTCYVLGLGNSVVNGTINAIARPLASSDIVPVSKDSEIQDSIEMEILEELMEVPNEDEDGYDFKYNLAIDYLTTGNNYIEVSYNQWGVPSALYRHLPYLITRREDGRYQHKNGYIFAEDEIIHNKFFNPFSTQVGMSPLVPLVASIMLDETIMASTMKNYEGGPKGLLSIDKSMPSSIAEKEVKRVQKKVLEMRKKKQSGHLATFGMSFQAIASTNKDMMTPDTEDRIRKRIYSVYGVPPAKVSDIESGNLGGGTGESQDETMNETLKFWGRKSLLGGFKKDLIRYCQFTETTLDFMGLTKKDERRLAEKDNINLSNGSTTLNRVLASRGEPLYDDPLADQPLVPSNLVPLNLLGYTPPTPTSQRVLDRVEEKVRERGHQGAYVVYGRTLDEI